MTNTDLDPVQAGARTRIGRALWTLYQLQLRLLITPGRLIVMLVLGALAVLIGAILGSTSYTPTLSALELVSTYGLILLLPVVALVFSSSTLGDLREDETLVYLWLRPLPRWVLAVASWLAAFTITWPLTVLPLVLAVQLTGAPSNIAWATLAATSLGALTYTSVFCALGLRAKRALMWGLLYIFIWEGFIANASEGAAQLAILAYTRSVLTQGTPHEFDLAVIDPPWTWIVPVLVAIAGLAYTVRRLRRQDVP